MHPTVTALMRRGLDSYAANQIRGAGYTLQKLKQESASNLKLLGIPERIAKDILKEQRPPIPNDNLHKVLFDNRFQCCVCRNPTLSIVVHHIKDWAKSHDHSIENLAVLCQQHHDDAHSTKKLTQNLDQKAIRDAKIRWEDEVKKLDTRAILSAMALEYATWIFINELRVFDIASQLGIDTRQVRGFRNFVSIGVAQENGLPAAVTDTDKHYMYEGEHIQERYFFVSNVLRQVINRISIINISDHLDKGIISTSMIAGDIVFVQGKHIFSPITSKKGGTGRGQICEGSRSANGVEVRFVFDRWEATSSSARHCWLTGTRDVGSLLHVKDVCRDQNKLILTGTVLGICTNNGNLKTRDYAVNLWRSDAIKDPYTQFDEDDDFDQAEY